MTNKYSQFFDDMYGDSEGLIAVFTRDSVRSGGVPILLTRTNIQMIDQYQVKMLSKIKDITCKANDIVINDEVIMPTKGDLVEIIIAGVKYVYEIYADVAPTYQDVMHSILKIHVHEIEVDTSTVTYNTEGEPVYNANDFDIFGNPV